MVSVGRDPELEGGPLLALRLRPGQVRMLANGLGGIWGAAKD